MKKIKYLLSFLLFILLFNFANALTVRYALHQGFLRIVFQTDKEVAWKERPYPRDKILVITIEGIDRSEVKNVKSQLEKALKNYANRVDVIDRSNTLKVIIKFNDKAPGYKIFSLKSPYRIVLDIVTSPLEENNEDLKTIPDYSKKLKKKDVIADIIKKKGKIKRIKKVAKRKIKKSHLKIVKRKHRKIIIVLDPGHGGKDPGATANGLKEKDVTLKFAKRIKYYLEKDGRFKVYLTRNTDKFIPLYERSLFAIKKNADMFISIHCNALPKDKTYTGTYVYTLNLKGAKSKMARIVERRENKIVMKYIKVSSNSYVNRIVADLAVSSTMIEGRRFSKYLKKHLRKITKFRKIDSANFAVLKTPGIPSVLIETLFITTPEDAKKLKSWHFRDKFSYSVYKAIADYFF